MTTTKKLSWNDPRALRALADMQRQIAVDMRDLACRMAVEAAAADTEKLIGEAAEHAFDDSSVLYRGVSIEPTMTTCKRSSVAQAIRNDLRASRGSGQD